MVNPCKSQFYWLDSTFCRSTPMFLLFKASLKPYNSPRLSPAVPGLLVDMAQTRLPLHDVAGLSVVDACARAGPRTVGWRVMTTLLKDVPPVVAKQNRLLGIGERRFHQPKGSFIIYNQQWWEYQGILKVISPTNRGFKQIDAMHWWFDHEPWWFNGMLAGIQWDKYINR